MTALFESFKIFAQVSRGRSYRLLMCALLGLIFSEGASAEGNCPPGYFPIGGGNAGWEGCAPMGPMPSDGDGSNQAPVQQEPVWETRWGAIATADGAYGVSNGMNSQRRAEKKAIADCKARSNGKPCILRVAYYNQCAALAWGDEINFTARSPQQQRAESLAVSACSDKTTNCRVYYSGCSYPEQGR
jgi:hypothetical protein